MDFTKFLRKRLWLIGLVAVVCVSLLAPAGALADQNDLDKVQKAIKEKKAKWEAGPTSVSDLSVEEKQKRAGARMPVVTPEEEEIAAEEQEFLAAVTAPAAYDWRAATGPVPGSYVTPVRNQGSCGSCWAFATTGAAESQVLLSYQTPGADMNLSEQVLVSCGEAGSCSGGYISTASNYVRDLGLPLESCYPYTATNGVCTTACVDWPDAAYRISGWRYVATSAALPTVETLKNALCTYGPMVTTMAVYSDFYYYRSGVYNYTSGTYVGGHAVLLVGYDDASQCFIVKNSWGTGWGEAGYFRIAYSELASAVSFARNTLGYEGAYGPGDPPGPEPPPPACTYALAPSGQTFKATGGSGLVTVTTQSACAWTAVSNTAWLSVTSGASGSSNGTVGFAVAVNPYKATRTGTLTIAGQTFTVTQQGAKVVKK